jgi:hypothetical protein
MRRLLVVVLLYASEGLAAKPVHPYAFYTKDRIDHLRAAIKSDTLIERGWTAVLAKADKALTQENPVSAIEDLGLVYRVTGDGKYAQKLKQCLQTLCALPVWESTALLSREPAWNAGLDLADRTYKASLAYDCIYDAFSDKERKAFADSIVAKGIRPALGDWIDGDTRIHSLNSMGHNWWSACVYMAGVGALTVRKEEPEANEWIKTIADASLQWFDFEGDVLNNKPRTFDRAGGFYESVGYASFAMKEYLLFRLAYTNIEGKPPFDIPLLKTLGDFFTQASYPNDGPLLRVDFGDSHADNRDWYPVLLLLANGYDSPANRWLLQQLGKSERYEQTGMGLAYYTASAQQTPDLPTTKLYKDMGWALLRSSWDNNATLLAVKSGETWNHAHADANSFILFYQGQYLLTDGGTVFYNNPLYSDYYFQSRAHNVVLFNGQAQSTDDEYYGVKTPGHLYNLIDAGDLKYVYGDATGPTARYFERNFRHFLWIGNVILVIDDLKTYEAGTFEWLLHHGEATAKQVGEDIEVDKGNARVLVRPLFPETLVNGGFPHDFPEKMVLKEQEGYKDHDAATKESYLSVVAPGQTRQTKFITAIILPGQGALPRIDKIEGKDMIGVKITQDGKETDVYLNLLADGRMMGRNSNNAFGGWETDAYLTAVTQAGGVPQRYFVAYGSYLRREGHVVLNSLSKVFMEADRQNVRLQGQPRIEADLAIPGQPAHINLNGKTVAPLYNGTQAHLLIEETQP